MALALASCEMETSELEEAVSIDPVPLSEVDVVDLGGDPGGPTLPMVVSVGATGIDGRLTSWKVTTPGTAPVALVDSPVIPGSNHQLHVLTPRVSPTLERQLLVSASIAAGHLVLRTWRVAANGAFTALDVETYAPAGVTVLSYALGHRQIVITPTTKRYQLVTPIARAGGNLRFVTWEVDGTTGLITAREDTGDVPSGLAADPQLAVSYVPGTLKVRPHYATSFLTGANNISNTLWFVTDLGHAEERGAMTSGMDIDVAATVVRSATSLASATLAQSGFVTVGDSTSQAASTAELQVWEDVTMACSSFSAGCIIPSNISDSSRDLAPNTPGVQQSALALTAPRAAMIDPAYALELFTKSPDSIQALASVRKVMILIVALDAVTAGTVSLDDVVVVSNNAASAGGSTMGLVAGEQMTLRDLMYGMMMVSAGDAAWAISEHVAGSANAMVTLMNAKASALGLTNTVYCHDAGSSFSSVGYSTARDQANLWASVYTDTTFLDVAGKASANVCGTLPDSSILCHPTVPPMTKDMAWYIELDGWKGGNGGASCAAYSALYKPCTTCLSSQATRLGRAMIGTALESSGASTVFGDSIKMYDYSYRQIFTPDFRGDSGATGGAATDFGVDTINDTFAQTAVIAGTSVKLCNWAVDAGLGTTVKLVCGTHSPLGLTSGGAPAIARRVQLAPLSSLEAEADYVLGRVSAGALKLSLWRVGHKD